jgi:hypothetical protein
MALPSRIFKPWYKQLYGGSMCKCNNSGCGCNTKKLDLNKPVRTKDGKQVRILCTDGPDINFPVLGIIQGERFVNSWNFNGNAPSLAHRDLVNVELETFIYANVYEHPKTKEQYIAAHTNKQRADDASRHSDRLVGKMKIKLERRFDW